ncbi:hypothetical protein Landi51_10260 [Colletotrichum acutatum]
MSNSSIQAQWSLSATSQWAFATLSGFLTAATSDNVQVLAILACEKFGNTLSLSSEAIDKVECVLLPTTEPVPVSFLRATVGLSQGDCAVQLGKSAAGVRFLGLAAALVTTLDPIQSAKALEGMLKTSTSELALIPSLRHLRDLLGSLEARSQRCGFADSAVGWQLLLRGALISQRKTQQNDSNAASANSERFFIRSAPSAETIAALVDTFRQLARLGPSTVIGATIRVGASAPWVCAFTQWCFEPPSVYFEGAGDILEHPQSRIRIIVSKEINRPDEPMEVTMHHKLENLTRILEPASGNLTTGMVTIESYGAWMLQELGFTTASLRLLHEALGHGIPQVLAKMECGEFGNLGRLSNPGRWPGSNDNLEDICRLSPLPATPAIMRAYTQLLGATKPPQFRLVGKDVLVADLPLVSRHLQSLALKCGCAKCNEGLDNPSSMRSGGGWCDQDAFYRSLSFIMMDIFAVSIIESPSPLLLKLSLDREINGSIECDVSKVLQTGSSQKFVDVELLEWARCMVGHNFDDEDRSLIMTCKHGQAIYPAIFETFKVEKTGYLKLQCLAGNLKYKDDTYDLVSCYEDDATKTKLDGVGKLTTSDEVLQPLNLMKNFELSWKLKWTIDWGLGKVASSKDLSIVLGGPSLNTKSRD